MFKYVGVVSVIAFCAYSLYAYTPKRAKELMQEAKATTDIAKVRGIKNEFERENHKMPGTYNKQIADLKVIIDDLERAGAGTRGGGAAAGTTGAGAGAGAGTRGGGAGAAAGNQVLTYDVMDVMGDGRLTDNEKDTLKDIIADQALVNLLDQVLAAYNEEANDQASQLPKTKALLVPIPPTQFNYNPDEKKGTGAGASAATGPLMKPDYAKLASAAQGLGEPLNDEKASEKRTKLRASVKNKLGKMDVNDLILTIRIGFNEIANDINTVDASKAAKIYDRYYKFTFAAAMALEKNPSEAQILEIRNMLKTVIPQAIINAAKCDVTVGESYPVNLDNPKFTESNAPKATPQCAIKGLANAFPLYQ